MLIKHCQTGTVRRVTTDSIAEAYNKLISDLSDEIDSGDVMSLSSRLTTSYIYKLGVAVYYVVILHEELLC